MANDGHPGTTVSLANPKAGPASPSNGTEPPETGAFATAQDLADRWHALTTDEQAKATALLDDAADLIRTTCPKWRDAAEPTLKRVSCAAVKRAMLNGDDAAGVTQHTETAGAYTESFSYSNPAGDLYLTASEIESLGGPGTAWAYDTADGSVK